MQVFEPMALADLRDMPTLPVCGLLQAVGRKDFLARVLHSLLPLAHPDYVSIFAFPHAGRPVFFGTDSSNSPLLASRAAEHYVGQHYRDDPNRSMLVDHAEPGAPTKATYMRRDDVPTAGYRLMCYDRAQIADRFSVLTRADQDQPLSISLYRSIHSGPFGPNDIVRLLGFVPVLRAAVARHLDLGRSKGLVDTQTALAGLRERFPALSRREGEVAAGMVAGMKGEEIADWLGIRLTSVITHRKNAYARLGVSGARELTMLFYAH